MAEHYFLGYKSLTSKDLALSIPGPIGKVTDVASAGAGKLLEVGVPALDLPHALSFKADV